MADIFSANEIPDGVFKELFSYFYVNELATLSLVCKSWKKHAEGELLWKEFCRDIGVHSLANCPTWRENYKKHAARSIVWKWSKTDKDSAIQVEEEVESGDNEKRNTTTIAKRLRGGHNPSVRGDKKMTGTGKYYYEVLIQSVGDWVSFGFSNVSFGVSSRLHLGKGEGSCGYYSDSSTTSIFWRFGDNQKSQSAKPIKSGDKIGCLLDLRSGSVSFYINGLFEAEISNPAWWSNDPVIRNGTVTGDSMISNEIDSTTTTTTTTLTTQYVYYPALSVGINSSVKVVNHPKYIPYLSSSSSLMINHKNKLSPSSSSSCKAESTVQLSSVAGLSTTETIVTTDRYHHYYNQLLSNQSSRIRLQSS